MSGLKLSITSPKKVSFVRLRENFNFIFRTFLQSTVFLADEKYNVYYAVYGDSSLVVEIL